MQWLIFLLAFSFFINACKQSENQVVVLTFDDAVKSHYNFVAPLLKEMGFGATFFISARWMSDSTNFMSWEEIGELHKMGFEIGNHSWSHLDFSSPENLARLEGELGLVDLHLKWQEVPKPVSFAYCGNWFGPGTVDRLSDLGYKFARRGMQPEVDYGDKVPGPLYNPGLHHPLLIPSAGDAYPDWDFDHFKKVVNRAEPGKIAVVQFHGVPDPAHPWVTTDPGLFKQCMEYLKAEQFQVIAMRDLEQYLPESPPDDSMLTYTHTSNKDNTSKLPPEMVATRDNLEFWISNMLDHGYNVEEMQLVTGLANSGASARRHPRGYGGQAHSNSNSNSNSNS